MNHSRKITIGDRNEIKKEDRFIYYPSGKIIVNFGAYKSKELKRVPRWLLKFYLTFDDLNAKDERAIKVSLRNIPGA
jgi:hypothetical protein